MDPNIWGPKVWDVLFSCAFEMPKERSHEFFTEMKHLIPCIHCLRSYVHFCTRLDPMLCINEDKDSAAKWLWTIHDMVNQKLNKPCIPFSTLVNRRKTFTSYTAVYDVMDVCMLLAIQAKTPEATSALAKILVDFKYAINPKKFRPFLTAAPPQSIDPDKLWCHILACKNNLHMHLEEPIVTHEAAILQYSHSQLPANASVKPLSSRRRRR